MGSSSHTSKIKRGKDAVALDIIAYGFCGIIALVCLVPFIMIVSGSFSSESAIIQNGFSLLPQDFSLEAYKTVFKDPMVVFRAYGTTIGLTIVGTVLGLLLQTMTAYVLSRKEFEWRNQFSFFFYFTTLFSGGLVPYYVLMTQTLNLRDSYLALLLPLLFSVYNLLIMKSYIVGLPDSLIEAAKIDGCGEFRILFRIVMPLIKPALATVGLFIALAYWNDWYNAMLYIKDTNKYPLQYLSQANFPTALTGTCRYDNIIQVDTDNEGAAEKMTTLLIGKGFRRFAFLVKDMSYNVDRKRHEGFCRALIKNGISEKDQLFYNGSIRMEFLDAIIENIISKKVECIICGDDEICTMVMSRLQAEGYRIPKDVAIASLYNSTNLDCYSPAVTAVSVAASQMGGTAVRQLIQRLRGENYEKKTMLDYDILFRKSTN